MTLDFSPWQQTEVWALHLSFKINRLSLLSSFNNSIALFQLLKVQRWPVSGERHHQVTEQHALFDIYYHTVCWCAHRSIMRGEKHTGSLNVLIDLSRNKGVCWKLYIYLPFTCWSFKEFIWHLNIEKTLCVNRRWFLLVLFFKLLKRNKEQIERNLRRQNCIDYSNT